MSHTIKPGQKVRIIGVLIAVPADRPEGDVSDEISAILSENLYDDPESCILDWRYIIAPEDPPEPRHIVRASNLGVEEGEIFNKAAYDYSVNWHGEVAAIWARLWRSHKQDIADARDMAFMLTDEKHRKRALKEIEK